MKITEYAKTQTFTEGFPEGDTTVDLETAEFEDFEFVDDSGKAIKRTKIKLGPNEEYYCPRSIVKQLNKLALAGAKVVRVTRTGTTKEDTRYTAVKTG